MSSMSRLEIRDAERLALAREHIAAGQAAFAMAALFGVNQAKHVTARLLLRFVLDLDETGRGHVRAWLREQPGLREGLQPT